MAVRALAAIMGLAGPAAAAADAGLDLATGWVLAPGDDPARAGTAFDDSGWKSVRVGVPWGEAGFPDLHGFAWYRNHVVVPAAWKSDPAVREHGTLVLEMGPVDDVDETFVNGVRVGRTGGFPPEYETRWFVPRAYRIPASLINWGGVNTIAVRVYDGLREAGIYPGPVRLRPARLEDFITVDAGPANRDGVFPAGEPVALSVTITSAGTRKVRATLACTWMSDSISAPVALASTKSAIVIPARSAVSRTLALRGDRPGFVVANLELLLPGGVAIRRRFVLGSDIERVNRPEAAEPDFDAFWAGRKAALAKIPPKFTLTPQPGKSTSLVEVSIVEMVSYGGIRIRGWYTVPRTPGPHPGLLSVPGYGAAMEPATGNTWAAVLALDTRGHGISRTDFDPKDREYMWEGIDGPLNDYVYTGAFMDCIRGLDFLASRKEVDAKRLGVEGGSQGGGLTLATAGLDTRVIACAPDVPWLVDWPDYETHTAWAVEHYPKLLLDRPALTMESVRKTLSYIDAATFASRIKCPVMLSLGLQDDTCPPRITVTAYNRVHTPKSIHIYPYGGHDGGGDTHARLKDRWLAERLGVVAGSVPASGGNRLGNPGFETGGGGGIPPGWSAWGDGAVTTVADGAHGGKAAMQLDGKAGGQGIYQFTEGAVVGAEYEGSFWARAESGDEVEVGVKLEFQNSADGKMQSQWSLRVGRAWKRFSYRAVAPAETLRAGLTVVVGPGVVARFDDMALVVAGTPRPAGPSVYDLTKFSGTIAGWGVHHWADNKKAAAEFSALNITHIRIAKDGSSWDDLIELRRLTDRLRIKWLFVKWSPPREMLGADGQLNDVPGFTREWIATLKDLDAHGCRPPLIDLSNEPDYFGIKAQTYNELVKGVRAALDANGFREIGIVGPGLTHIGADNFGGYERALDADAVKALAVWATHAWEDTWDDRSGNSSVFPVRAQAFVGRCRERDASKPVWYTEYATAARRFHGVLYPDSDTESANYCGSFTQAFAARTFENTLQILNHGADMAFYWCSEDFPGSKKQWGYIGPSGERKNIYWALHALYGNLKPGTKVVQAPAWQAGAPVTGVFVNGSTIFIAAVNTADREVSGSIRLEHAPVGLALVRSDSFEWKRAGDPAERRADEIVPGPRALRISRTKGVADFRFSLPADGWACWVLSSPAGQ